jgi:hypothetical protein
MGSNGMEQCLRKLPQDKIEINWNKKPVRMDLFLSFLTNELTRSSEHLGHCNGWTRLFGDDDLEVGGGMVGGVEYLDTLQYRRKLENPYNNYVSPFSLFEIMTTEGKQFFLDYYSTEIQEQLKLASDELTRAKRNKAAIFDFWKEVGVDLS